MQDFHLAAMRRIESDLREKLAGVDGFMKRGEYIEASVAAQVAIESAVGSMAVYLDDADDESADMVGATAAR